MPQFDVIIRNGEVVTSAGSLGVMDLGISGGRIAQLGGDLQGSEELDAGGMYVLPGGIDAHVHLTYPEKIPGEPAWVDDFTSGSAAALAGGITTLGNMTFPKAGETPLESLARETVLAVQQSIADYFLHPVFDRVTPDVLDDIPKLRAAGCNTIKFFTVFPWFESQIPGVIEALRRAKKHGLLTMIHCEDHGIIEAATRQLVDAGHNSLRFYPESRPVVSEVIATQRAVALAEVSGAPIYVVHLSAARALTVCREAQARGLPVYVETRPLYLHLTRELFDGPEGGKYLGQPPLREAADIAALWVGLAQGTVHTVCTDHAPYSLAAKLDQEHTLTNLRPGVANLQTQRPMLFSEGVRSGKITLGQFVALTATNVARLFGLYPRKGEISVGSDADLVIFDPHRTRTITSEMLKSNADYSPYEGREVTGWPVTTLRRGEIVFHEGEILGSSGSGRLVDRGETQAL